MTALCSIAAAHCICDDKKVYNLNTYFTEPFFETKQLVYVPR
jgi:hypothetical protein